jgi:hypothetical protein
MKGRNMFGIRREGKRRFRHGRNEQGNHCHTRRKASSNSPPHSSHSLGTLRRMDQSVASSAFTVRNLPSLWRAMARIVFSSSVLVT